MPGRRPVPTSLQLLKGTKRNTRPRVEEPIPPPGEIVRPDFIKFRAKEIWEEYEPIFKAMGTLTVADVRAFAKWCKLEADFEEHPPNAALVAQARLLGADLGVSASARAKIGLGKGKQKAPEDKYFNAS